MCTAKGVAQHRALRSEVAGLADPKGSTPQVEASGEVAQTWACPQVWGASPRAPLQPQQAEGTMPRAHSPGPCAGSPAAPGICWRCPICTTLWDLGLRVSKPPIGDEPPPQREASTKTLNGVLTPSPTGNPPPTPTASGLQWKIPPT